MPYCSGCGSRYQEGDRVCKSCGFILTGTAELPSGEKGMHPCKRNPKARGKKKMHSPSDASRAVLMQPDGPSPDAEPEMIQEPVQPDGLSETRQLQSGVVDLAIGLDEIHLGKGIIKPKTMEWGIDGFHFKYEEQPQAVQNSELLLNEPGEMGVPAVKAIFSDELPPDPGRSDALNYGNQRPVKPPGVSGSIYSLKNETNSVAHQASEPVKAPPVMSEEAFDNLVIDSMEAELRDFEAALAEVRQAEADLISEMEAAEKRLEQQDITAGESGENDGALGSKDWTASQAVNLAQETGVNIVDEIIFAASDVGKTTDHQSKHSQPEPGLATQQQDGTVILMHGRQSWYGIPLPYYYRLTEQLLVCTEPNGRSFEYELTMLKKVTLKQSWLGKLLGVGDVELDFNNRIPSRYCLAGIANPAKLRAILDELLRKGV